MLNIGNKIIDLGKVKNWLQSELAKAIEASGDTIGQNERKANSLIMTWLLKLPEFDVPVVYLLGKGKHAAYDNDTVKRIG